MHSAAPNNTSVDNRLVLSQDVRRQIIRQKSVQENHQIVTGNELPLQEAVGELDTSMPINASFLDQIAWPTQNS